MQVQAVLVELRPPAFGELFFEYVGENVSSHTLTNSMASDLDESMNLADPGEL